MSKSFTSTFGTIAVAMVMVTASAARENATPAVGAKTKILPLMPAHCGWMQPRIAEWSDELLGPNGAVPTRRGV